jgi:DNA-binding NarL/FixJ family response regulator
VDDHTILRQGLTNLLNAAPDLEVSGASASVGEALVYVGSGLADVVLLDLDLGAERGTDFLVQARRNGFRGPVLVLTAAVPPSDRGILEENQVAAILSKDATVHQVADYIRAAVAAPGPLAVGRVASGEMAGRRAPEPPRLPDFSSRETRVLRLVVEGLSNKAIAAELESNEPVIKSVLQQLFRKTATRTRAQLVRFALEQFRSRW